MELGGASPDKETVVRHDGGSFRTWTPGQSMDWSLLKEIMT